MSPLKNVKESKCLPQMDAVSHRRHSQSKHQLCAGSASIRSTGIKAATLPGVKLQPLHKDAAPPASRSSSGGSDHFPVLPTIGCSQQQAVTEAKTVGILRGDLSAIPPVEADAVRVYLCYVFEEMRVERDWLWQMAVPQLRRWCSEQHSLTLVVIDLPWDFHYAAAPPHHSSSSSSLSAAAAAATAGWQKSLQISEMLRCQTQSIGPDFILLYGEKPSSPPMSLTDSQFAAVRQALHTYFANDDDDDDAELLSSCYVPATDSDQNTVYMLNKNMGAEMVEKLRVLLSTVSSLISDPDLVQELVDACSASAAVDEDITSGVLQRSDARERCLAYRRKVSAADVTDAEKESGVQDDVTGQSRGTGRDGVWRKVEQCLGLGQAREYTVTSAPRLGELTPNHDDYLRRLSDDFVSDVKELIVRNLARMRSGASSGQLVREVLHHAALARDNLETCSDRESGTGTYFDELFRRLQSYIRDPAQNCYPFVIYGLQGGGDRSRAMSAVASALPDWLSNTGGLSATGPETSGPVIILRFIGTSTDSSDVQRCVASVRAQIQTAYAMELSPSCDSLHSELTTFRRVLQQVSTGHAEPLFILLDGVECLLPHRSALQALWTVRHLPSNIYVIMSVTVGYHKTGGVNILKALLTLVGNPDLTFNIACDSDQEFMQVDVGRRLTPRLAALNTEVLTSTLDALEVDHGQLLVQYFASYVAIVNVGVCDSELYDLLVTNDEAVTERGRVWFSPGLVSILRHRLADFLAPRLVQGCVAFSWSRPEYLQAIAERYQVIVDRSVLEVQESTSFTLALHSHIVDIYQNVTRKRSVSEESMSVEDDLDNDDCDDNVRISLQTLGSQNPVKAKRLLQHLRVLLPAEGLERIKSCVLFNLDWLMSRLSTSPVCQLVNDVLSVYQLCQKVITTESFEDVGILLEFLQSSSKALGVNRLFLPAEIITGLGHSSLTEKYRTVAELVTQSRRWLANTEFAVLVPFWSVWDRPGGMRRHVLDGVSHVLGSVDCGQTVVGFNQQRVSVWDVLTGQMLQNFEVKSEQRLSEVVAAERGTFIVTSCYSAVTRQTELTVHSTETGLRFLSLDFPRQFEAVALNRHDQLFIVSSLSSTDSGDREIPARLILGINITSRDVIFQLSLVDVHSQGVEKLMLVDICGVDQESSESLLSIGTRASRDLALWNIKQSQLQFSLSVSHPVDFAVISTALRAVLCGGADAGVITVISLIDGSIQHTFTADEYRGMADLAVSADRIFVATPAAEVRVISASQGVVVCNLHDPGGPSVPTKLLLRSLGVEQQLVVGYRHGLINVFDVDAGTLVCSLPGHSGRINSLHELPSRQLISASENQQAIIWNYPQEHESGVTSSEMWWTKSRRRCVEGSESVLGGDDFDASVNRHANCYTLDSSQCLLYAGFSAGFILVFSLETGEALRELSVSSANCSVDRLRLVHGDKLLLIECGQAELPHVKLQQLRSVATSEKLSFHDNNADADELAIYCSQVFASEERLLTIGPSTDSAKPGIVIALHHLTLLRTLTKLHCDVVSGNVNARSLHIIGVSHSRSDRSISTGGKVPVIPQRSSRRPAGGGGGRVSVPTRRVVAPDVGFSTASRCSSSNRFLFLLGFFPAPADTLSSSYFYTVSVDGCDWLSMECSGPMSIETLGPGCSVLLPQGALAFSGTAAGTMIRWNIRSRKIEAELVDVSLNDGKAPRHTGMTDCVGGPAADTQTVCGLAHVGPVTSLALEATGSQQLLVSGGQDHFVRVWSILNNQLLCSLTTAHSQPVRSLFIESSQKLILSADDDQNVVIWQKSTTPKSRVYEKLGVFCLHGNVSSITMTTDRRRIIALLDLMPLHQHALLLLRTFNI